MPENAINISTDEGTLSIVYDKEENADCFCVNMLSDDGEVSLEIPIEDLKIFAKGILQDEWNELSSALKDCVSQIQSLCSPLDVPDSAIAVLKKIGE